MSRVGGQAGFQAAWFEAERERPAWLPIQLTGPLPVSRGTGWETMRYEAKAGAWAGGGHTPEAALRALARALRFSKRGAA